MKAFSTDKKWEHGGACFREGPAGCCFKRSVTRRKLASGKEHEGFSSFYDLCQPSEQIPCHL